MATVNFNEIPVGVTLSVENIERLTNRTREVSIAFAARLEKIQVTFNDARNQYGREAKELVSSSDPDSRAVAKQFAKKQEASRIVKMRTSLVESTRREREELLNILAKYANEAEFLSTLHQSPTQILGRVGLGDTKRTQYQMQLEGAGPVELETAARTAITTHDLLLAAAIVTVIDRRPADRRPFAANDFATRIFGAEFEKVSTQLAGIQLAYKTAIAANNEFVRGRADPMSNLSNALAARAIAEASGEDD
ncbi:hypothetical protein [Rhodanobacter soli]